MRLAYSDDGPGSAVILLHGFPLSRVMWEKQVAGIGSIYRVIAPDSSGTWGLPCTRRRLYHGRDGGMM